MLKGYLDRVWNYGLGYGPGGKLGGKKIRWVALVGGSQEGLSLCSQTYAGGAASS